MRVMPVLVAVAVLVSLVVVVTVLRRTPRSDRDWAADHAMPARTEIAADTVRIEGFRDFEHGPGGAFVERYRDHAIELERVRRVWFVLAPFARRFRGLAHTFVTFELDGGEYVAVSVEARREHEEPYSLVGGLLRGFEMTYVIGSEADLIGLRALRGDTLYLYPSRATPRQARSMFVDMMRAAEDVRTRPRFYHTLTNNCSTVLRNHVNRVIEDPLPWGWGLLLPGYSDGLAMEHGLLDTTLPLDQARTRFRVDEQARRALARGLGGPEFSRAIRAGMPP